MLLMLCPPLWQYILNLLMCLATPKYQQLYFHAKVRRLVQSLLTACP